MLDDYKDLILDESLTTIVSETKQLKSKQKKNHILSVMVQWTPGNSLYITLSPALWVPAL